MTSQPDNLFRNKLENFQHPAPASAWDRVERNLAKPSKKVIWFRAAAAVSVLITAAVWLWPQKPVTDSLAVKPTAVSKPTTQATQPVLKDNDSPQHIVPRMHQASTKPAVAEVKKELPVKKNNTTVHKKDSITVTLPETGNEPLLVAQQPAVTTGTKADNNTSTVIVYTAEEVNSKFLKKKLSPEATPEAQDASGIQKLIGLAYTAKNSESALSNLRERKDEILALNFRSKKGEN